LAVRILQLGRRHRFYSGVLQDVVAESGCIVLAEQLAGESVQSLRPSCGTPQKQIRRRMKPPRYREPIAAEIKHEILQSAVADLEAAGIRPFLCFGLLLGYVRQRDYMAHDMDLDLGFLYDETKCSDVYQVLLSKGYEVVLYDKDPWPCRLKVRHKNHPIMLDLVFFRAAEGRLQTFAPWLGKTLIRNRTPFRLVRADFRGLQVWIPESPETFLDENYGNWNQKSAYHHFVLTSRLTDFAEPVVKYSMRRALATNMYWRQDDAVKFLIELGQEKYPTCNFWRSLDGLVLK
jgi:hypothetical protein